MDPVLSIPNKTALCRFFLSAAASGTVLTPNSSNIAEFSADRVSIPSTRAMKSVPSCALFMPIALSFSCASSALDFALSALSCAAVIRES